MQLLTNHCKYVKGQFNSEIKGLEVFQKASNLFLLTKSSEVCGRNLSIVDFLVTVVNCELPVYRLYLSF